MNGPITITLTEAQRKALAKLLKLLWDVVSPFGPIIIQATHWLAMGLGRETRAQGFLGQELVDLRSIETLLLVPPNDPILRPESLADVEWELEHPTVG